MVPGTFQRGEAVGRRDQWRCGHQPSGLCDLGGDAVEVSCGAHDGGQVLAFARLARKYGLLASRASDFHGPEDSLIDLGRASPLPPDLTPVWTAFR